MEVHVHMHVMKMDVVRQKQGIATAVYAVRGVRQDNSRKVKHEDVNIHFSYFKQDQTLGPLANVKRLTSQPSTVV